MWTLKSLSLCTVIKQRPQMDQDKSVLRFIVIPRRPHQYPQLQSASVTGPSFLRLFPLYSSDRSIYNVVAVLQIYASRVREIMPHKRLL